MTAKLVTTATDNKTSSRGGAKTNSSFDIKACWKSWEEWVLKWFQINATQMLKNLVEVWRVSEERILLSGGSLHHQTTHNHYSLSTASTHLSTLSAVSHTHDWTLFIFQPFSLHLDTDPPWYHCSSKGSGLQSLPLRDALSGRGNFNKSD